MARDDSSNRDRTHLLLLSLAIATGYISGAKDERP